MRSGIVFLISFCLLSTTCIQQRQKLETKECSTTQTDTSFIVVDSTLLLYLKKNTSDKEIYAVLEERPEYPGGMDEVVKYIQTHIQYPPAAIYKKIQGRVWIESVIDRNGKVVQPKVAYSVHPLLDQEALRIIRMMPDWKPGKLNGETVKVKYVFPVTFRLEDHMVLVDEGPKRNPNDTGAVEIEYIPPVNFDSVIKKSPSVKWGLLVDDTEGVIKIHLDDWTHKEIKSKSKDVRIISSSLSNDKVYVSIFSTSHYLTYKGEYIFYREDKQKRLHEIYCKNIDKESVALQVERGKEAEIGIDLPKNAQPGDYLLKIRVYDENETCFYNIYQWFEAYTSQQVSTRERPIPVGPANCKKVFPDEEGVFDVVQHMPEFPGGMLKLMEFIRQNIQYPQAAKQNKLEGTVIMQVVIDKDGTVTQPRILCSVNPVLSADAALCEEALRIVSIMPKWKPGKQRGKEVRVSYTVPVIFSLDGKGYQKAMSTAKGNTKSNATQAQSGSDFDENQLFQIVEEMPEFPGGMGACLKFLMANTEYPEKAKAQKVEGKVSVKFVVEKDGSISNPQIIKGGNPLLNDEALRVVNSMPKWKPGKQRGKVVRVGYTVPIIFKLQ